MPQSVCRHPLPILGDSRDTLPDCWKSRLTHEGEIMESSTSNCRLGAVHPRKHLDQNGRQILKNFLKFKKGRT